MSLSLKTISGLGKAALTFAEIRAVNTLSRPHFEMWQSWRLTRWLTSAPRRVNRYAPLGRNAHLDDFPIITKTHLMNAFEAFNVPQITADTGWAAFAGDRMVGPYHVGASTGTSGNRGLYVISDQERFAWLGAILAKAMPDIWKPWSAPERVAVILPLHTRLYDAAESTGRVAVRFFDVTQGFDAWAEDLHAFAPTTVIAPPKVLRWMAETWTGVAPVRMFSGAEVLDDIDRRKVEERFSLKLGQIYMATEGLLAVSCPHGSLHLCEDVMHFELSSVEGTDLVSPIITDFRRRTQVMLRYRMNDLLRMDPTPCACGSPCRVVKDIIGRQDDVFGFRGDTVFITPDVMRNAIVDADRSIEDFRLVQEDDQRVTLHLPNGASKAAADAAVAALHAVFSRFGVPKIDIQVIQRTFKDRIDRKLRRVERVKR